MDELQKLADVRSEPASLLYPWKGSGDVLADVGDGVRPNHDQVQRCFSRAKGQWSGSAIPTAPSHSAAAVSCSGRGSIASFALWLRERNDLPV
jgi:hypothetical protein